MRQKKIRLDSRGIERLTVALLLRSGISALHFAIHRSTEAPLWAEAQARTDWSILSLSLKSADVLSKDFPIMLEDILLAERARSHLHGSVAEKFFKDLLGARHDDAVQLRLTELDFRRLPIGQPLWNTMASESPELLGLVGSIRYPETSMSNWDGPICQLSLAEPIPTLISAVQEYYRTGDNPFEDPNRNVTSSKSKPVTKSESANKSLSKVDARFQPAIEEALQMIDEHGHPVQPWGLARKVVERREH